MLQDSISQPQGSSLVFRKYVPCSLTLCHVEDLSLEGYPNILMNIGMYFVAPAIVIFRIKNR